MFKNLYFKFSSVFSSLERIKINYIELMNQSQVFNYAIQLYQSVNGSRKSYSGVRFSQAYNIHLYFKTDPNAETIEIHPYQTIIIKKDNWATLDAETENSSFRLFINEASPEMNFKELGIRFKMPMKEIDLYVRHLIYHRRAILIHKLDDFSYFMLNDNLPAINILNVETKITKDLNLKSNLGLTTYLSQHKSWMQIKRHYLTPGRSNSPLHKLTLAKEPSKDRFPKGPTAGLAALAGVPGPSSSPLPHSPTSLLNQPMATQKELLGLLCQLLSKRTIYEVELYLMAEFEELPGPVGIVLEACRRKISVKQLLAEEKIIEEQLKRVLHEEKSRFTFFYKF